MQILDKTIAKQFDLMVPVCFNSARSYRDGNLMWLNFSVVDKEKEHVFAIAGEFCRGNISEETIVDILNDPEMHNFDDMDELAFKLYSFALNHEWYPKLKYTEVSDKIDDTTVALLFNYLSVSIPAAIKAFIDRNLDFFSLQTKEEYEKKEAIINASSEKLKGKIMDLFETRKDEDMRMGVYVASQIFHGAAMVPLDWGKEMDKELEKNTPGYVSWISDTNLEMIYRFPEETGIYLDFRNSKETVKQKILA